MATAEFTTESAKLRGKGDTNQSETTDLEEVCLETRYWSYFLASSLIVFFLGLIVILSYRLLLHLCGWTARRRLPPAAQAQQEHAACEQAARPGPCTRLKWHAEGWISGQTTTGKVMVSLSCVLSIGSLIIYLIDASRPGNKEETCVQWIHSPSQQVDLVFNIFFMFFFLIRLLAATDKLVFWLNIYSIVDYFTIPPAFVGIYLSRQWLGLRFLRALRVISFPDILQYLSLLRTSNSIRLAQLTCIFVSVWLAASGFIHLLETSGDPFYGFSNGQELTYWECVYMALVTMSTVGYGDLTCKTTLGRLFITFFIMGALAMFAGSIPEIMEILGRRERYGGGYDKPTGVKHIVVCGHINYESVHNFLRDFLHEDRENTNVKCIFLENREPDLELNALFKRHFTHVEYFKGTIMSTRDLERVKMKSADALLIMVNPRCRDPDAEDASNLMRVIAAKNFHENIRVIVQLMRHQNKAFCVNLPSWNAGRDQIICLAEMKLGFMAQGCLAPGFSTLLANLFVMRSYKKIYNYLTSRNAQWLDQYLRGAGMEVYSVHFSPEFYGQPFPVVAQFIYEQLELLLVAVATSEDDGDTYSHVILNPSRDFLLDHKTKGFFICEEQEEVKRVLYFCRQCHYKKASLQNMKRCDCKAMRSKLNGSFLTNGVVTLTLEDEDKYSERESCSSKKKKFKIATAGVLDPSDVHVRSESNVNNNENGLLPAQTQFADLVPALLSARHQPKPEATEPERFDSTGLFHWCPPRAFDDCILTHESNRERQKQLSRHIVLCTFADDKSPEMGLINFVMPLRASYLKLSELKTIVIIGNRSFLENEWQSLKTFPNVFIKIGSPLNRSDLRSVKINHCHMCVILTANNMACEDPTLVDKEAILCSLNIKTMTFGEYAEIWKTASPSRRMLAVQMIAGASSRRGAPVNSQTTGAAIPMLTELAHEFNAQFVDQDDEDDPDIPLYMTQPFACGRAFAASVLDSLMSTTYFNPESLNLVRMLITGGSTMALEQNLAEGHGMMASNGDVVEDERARDRSRVALLPLDSGKLEDFSCEEYGVLFAGALKRHGILCMGLYRNMDPRPTCCNYIRFVVTNPPADFPLIPSDKVYCLLPYEPLINSSGSRGIHSNGSASTLENNNFRIPETIQESIPATELAQNNNTHCDVIVNNCDVTDGSDDDVITRRRGSSTTSTYTPPPDYASASLAGSSENTQNAVQNMDSSSPANENVAVEFERQLERRGLSKEAETVNGAGPSSNTSLETGENRISAPVRLASKSLQDVGLSRDKSQLTNQRASSIDLVTTRM